jgi:hypothetical protein
MAELPPNVSASQMSLGVHPLVQNADDKNVFGALLVENRVAFVFEAPVGFLPD